MSQQPRLVYQQGDHVCTLYTNPQEQLTAATEYLRQGLDRGERCLYVCCEHDVATFRSALRDGGIDVESEENRGALIILTKEQGHLNGGTFDPDSMISRLYVAVKEALDAGFSGLCAAGDMCWVLEEADGTERLAEYEARLNRFYSENRALGLCLYNRRTIPATMLDHGLATHPVIRVEGPVLLRNPFYEEPEAAARRVADPARLPEKIAQIDASRSA